MFHMYTAYIDILEITSATLSTYLFYFFVSLLRRHGLLTRCTMFVFGPVWSAHSNLDF